MQPITIQPHTHIPVCRADIQLISLELARCSRCKYELGWTITVSYVLAAKAELVLPRGRAAAATSSARAQWRLDSVARRLDGGSRPARVPLKLIFTGTFCRHTGKQTHVLTDESGASLDHHADYRTSWGLRCAVPLFLSVNSCTYFS